MCTYFSVLKNLYGPQMDLVKLRREAERAVRLLELVFSLYQIQADSGRYYLHEHPRGASSWKEQVVTNFIAQQENPIIVSSPMCAFGMRA